MKVGIISLYGHSNFGNKLQNYAMQQILNELKVDSEIIEISNKKDLIHSLKFKVLVNFSPIYIKLCNSEKDKYIKAVRLYRFLKFEKKYIKKSKYKILNSSIPQQLNSSYNYFITGSDQVWNPEIMNDELNIYFLKFADKFKRIAFAPSFGSSYIPENKEKFYKKNLEEMKALSCREKAGIDIIYNLTGRNATLLLDPTFYLTKSEWLSIAKKPKNIINRKYILSYFLGSQTEEYRNKIKEISKKHNLEIINLLDINNKYAYFVDPAEFVYLINHAELICTDSFHGIVFSLIMNTPFIIFERKDHHISMNSRLENIVRMFNIEDRWNSNINEDNILNCDFSKIDLIIKNEKKNAMSFLKNSLKI